MAVYNNICTALVVLILLYHSELKWQIRLGNYSWGYNAPIFHFCLPLDFLGAKDFKKIIKGRPRSCRKGQIKGQTLVNSNFDNFFMSIWSFGVNFTHISLFSSFKVIKVKKATVIAGVAFLHCKLFIFLKVLL